uniref:Uncharacterized protein n=1 Tax=Timema shepardi TaxID=629360 RepID=A0A7R9AT04_TIMSH|nr:unnamed protein product [Timema shepardi]
MRPSKRVLILNLFGKNEISRGHNRSREHFRNCKEMRSLTCNRRQHVTWYMLPPVALKEEEWQHPHPMDETACQSPEEHIHIVARHKKVCMSQHLQLTDETALPIPRATYSRNGSLPLSKEEPRER